ncbi:MAG: helix-turn-helix domain-containing protein [Lachnospirales bacterium]
MTVNEKIKYYRLNNGLTQKELAERSGVSEISIRKYEAGDRNPKPEQIKKIADALGIGANLLMDFNLKDIQLETVGDFMSIIYVLRERIGMQLSCDVDEDGIIFPETLKINFVNENINEALSCLFVEDINMERKLNALLNNEPPIEDWLLNEHKNVMRMDQSTTKFELCSSKEPLFNINSLDERIEEE